MNLEDEISRRLEKGPFILDEYKSKRVLAAYGIPVVEEYPAQDPETAWQYARKMGLPVVLKALGSGLAHKTEHGLVKMNLNTEKQVVEAGRQILATAPESMEGLLVQQQISGAREILLGMNRDQHFGPVILLGLGGILAEAVDDVVLGPAPLNGHELKEMISGLRGAKLLGSFRGQKPVDLEALLAVANALSKLARDFPQLAEVDINPLLLDANGGLTAVDALLTFRPPTRDLTPPSKAVPKSIIHGFFHPRSVAFVGASGKLGKWGHMLTVNTIGGGFKGNVFLVNHKGGSIAGRRVFSSVEEIEAPVDLAVVTVPAEKVPALIEQFKRKSIDKVLLVTSGFGESGPAGKALEKELVSSARKAGIFILGPNTMGICNPHIDFFCTGTAVRPQAGSTAVIAQSGNMGTQLLAFAEQQGIGIRAFAGSGNEAMLTMADYLDALADDEQTRIIMVYLENISNGRRFFETARKLSYRKPIVLLKGGQTTAGSRAAASHTGALATDSRVFEAICRQAGIIKVEHPMDLLDLSAAFSSLPLPRGNRVAIMTLGGGWGVVTADLCERYGLAIPPLDKDIIAQIDGILPPYWSKSNPVDLVGEPDTSIPSKIMEILLNWDGCDAVIDLGILGRLLFIKRLAESIRKADPQTSEQTLQQILGMYAGFEKDYVEFTIKLMTRTSKPVFGVSLLAEAARKTVHPLKRAKYKAVYYETPERAVKAMAKMVQYHRFVISKPQ